MDDWAQKRTKESMGCIEQQPGVISGRTAQAKRQHGDKVDWDVRAEKRTNEPDCSGQPNDQAGLLLAACVMILRTCHACACLITQQAEHTVLMFTMAFSSRLSYEEIKRSFIDKT
jgi:hypothetical protein